MGKTMGGWLWQLERRRKYYMSLGNSLLLGNGVRMRSRAMSTIATTAITFLICVLLYVNLSSPNDSKIPSRSHLPLPHHRPSIGGGESLENIQYESERMSRNRRNNDINPEGVSKSPRIIEKVSRDFKGEAMLVSGRSHRFRSSQQIQPPKFSQTLLALPVDSNSNNVEKAEGSLPLIDEDPEEAEEKEGKPGKNKPLTKEEAAIQRIKRNFVRADVNRDAHLSFAELTKWINNEVKEHFTRALKDNFDSFFGIDKNPRNGRVEWAEYLTYHMNKMGFKDMEVTPEVVRSKDKFKLLPKHIKVEIAALEARWSETASNDPDFLTVDEFLAFTHPEASPTKLLSSVQDTFNTFDLDGDGTISQAEFDTTYAEAEGVDNVYKEDLHLIDADGNHQISRVELMRYMDPKNTVHAEKDARKLIQDLDKNGDDQLSLAELTKKWQLLLPTKFFDVAKHFHTNQLHS